MTRRSYRSKPDGPGLDAGPGPTAFRPTPARLSSHALAARLGGPIGALSTALLLVAAFPGPDHGWLAWVALAPLALVGMTASPPRAAALGLLAGSFAAAGVFGWILVLPAIRWYQVALLAVYLGLYPAAWCAALPRLARNRVALVVTAPSLWVLLEWGRGHAGFLALPWAVLAHSQHRDLAVLQLVAVTGEAGVSFLVALAGVAVAVGLADREWRSPLLAAGLVLIVHAAGLVALARPETPTGPETRLAALQPAIVPGEGTLPGGATASLDRLEALTRTAAAGGVALIAWPESAVASVASRPWLRDRLVRLARETGVPLLVGSADSGKLAPPSPGPRPSSRAHLAGIAPVGPPAPVVEVGNLAYLVTPGGFGGEPYRKQRLVPFGEYLPLDGLVRWPGWLVPAPLVVTAGRAPGRFVLPDGAPVGVVICWENLFPDLARTLVGRGARLVVQLTNDAWFGRTAEPAQHELASVLRAVENRVPVLVASNTGPSMLIDARGRVIARAAGFFTAEAVTGRVSLGPAGSYYTRTGDWFVVAALVTALLGWLTTGPRFTPSEGHASVARKDGEGARRGPRPVEGDMEQDRLTLYRTQLLEKRRQLEAEVGRSALYGKDPEDDATKDMGDQALSAYTREFQFELGSGERRVLRDVLAALKKVDDGSFGACERCGEEITERRLAALPFARYCIECQRKVESEERAPAG